MSELGGGKEPTWRRKDQELMSDGGGDQILLSLEKLLTLLCAIHIRKMVFSRGALIKDGSSVAYRTSSGNSLDLQISFHSARFRFVQRKILKILLSIRRPERYCTREDTWRQANVQCITPSWGRETYCHVASTSHPQSVQN